MVVGDRCRYQSIRRYSGGCRVKEVRLREGVVWCGIVRQGSGNKGRVVGGYVGSCGRRGSKGCPCRVWGLDGGAGKTVLVCYLGEGGGVG